MSPPQECRIDIRVRYAEVDQMGALHHSRYWVYFEMGRTELLRAAGVSYADLESAGVFLVVARCWAKYHSPARYDEVVSLTTRVTQMGQAKIDHEYELRGPDGRLLATAGTTLACVNRSGQVIPLPDAVRRGGATPG
jgi:acyl-CoA thioester hydrolase